MEYVIFCDDIIKKQTNKNYWIIEIKIIVWKQTVFFVWCGVLACCFSLCLFMEITHSPTTSGTHLVVHFDSWLALLRRVSGAVSGVLIKNANPLTLLVQRWCWRRRWFCFVFYIPFTGSACVYKREVVLWTRWKNMRWKVNWRFAAAATASGAAQKGSFPCSS